jgi:hypothetical protein
MAEVAQLANGFLKSKFKIVYCYMFVRMVMYVGTARSSPVEEEGAQKCAG